MSHDAAFRIAAVALAAALLAAPHGAQIKALARIFAAGFLFAAAWDKVPLLTLPVAPSRVTVDTPSDEMQRLVTPIAEALRGASPVDRALWAEVWTKAATVAAGDAVTTEVVFTDTRSLRAFTALAVDIAWRRIGNHAPGSNESLRKAVEAAYGAALGVDVVPVTADLRGRYVAFCRAVAWAGVNGG